MRKKIRLDQVRLKRAEQRLKLAIIERAPFSMWACSRDYEIVLWTANAAHLYGLSDSEVLGKNYLDLFVDAPEREQSQIDCLRVIDEDYKQSNFFAYDRRQDGSRLLLLTNVFRIYDNVREQYLQAEVALNVSDLESRLYEHQTLRDLGTKRLIVKELIGSSIFGEAGLHSVFEQIGNELNDMIGVNLTSVVYPLNETTGELGEPIGAENKEIYSIKAGYGKHIISQKVPLFLGTSQALPADLSQLKTRFTQKSSALALLPLVQADIIVGLWIVLVHEPYIFPERIQTEVKDLAEQIAFGIAIRNLIVKLNQRDSIIAEKEHLVTRSLLAVDFIHRMNNVAGPIPSWAELIREELDSKEYRKERVLEYLNEIEREAKDLIRSARELEDEPREENIDVNFLLNSLIRNLQIQNPRTTVEANLATDVPTIRANYSRLFNAISNVISNAIDSMPEGGVLRVNSQRTPINGKSLVDITISDTGVGIPIEERARIFDLDFSTKGAGRGYGLWRTKNILTGIGGLINLLDGEPKSGTTFRITLPSVH